MMAPASFDGRGKRWSRWPRHRAGFSPSRKPLALAASKTFSIRPRIREAVSAFVVQIGFRTASTSSVAMVSTGLAQRSGASAPKSVGLRSSTWRRFDPSSSPSAIDLGSLLSSSVDQPENPQQTETF